MSEWNINRARIRLELAKRDLSQMDLANLVGTSDASISRVLAGTQNSPRLIARIATALGIPLEDVLRVAPSEEQKTA